MAAMACTLRAASRAAIALAALAGLPAEPALAQTLPEALVRTYQNNPVLNAERARLRGVDETVPQALAGYRPQVMALLTGGLQQVRVLFPDNTIQTATLRTWTIGLTVSQTIFNGFKTANLVRQSEAQILAGREALRNTGQGVLLDAVTAYTNVLANQSLVEAQRINVTFLRETLGTTASASTPATSRQPTWRRPKPDRAAGLPISMRRKSTTRSARRSTCRSSACRRAGWWRPIPSTGCYRARARRRWRSAVRSIPPSSRRCTTPTWPSSAPRSRRRAFGPTSRCRAASSANGRTTPR